MSEDGPLLGDMTAEVMRKLRVERAAKKFGKLINRDCGCAKRKEGLNNLHKKIIGKK